MHIIWILLFYPVIATLCPFSRPVWSLACATGLQILQCSSSDLGPKPPVTPHTSCPSVQLELHYLTNNHLTLRHTLETYHLLASLLTCNLEYVRGHWLEAQARCLLRVYNYWLFSHYFLTSGKELKLYVPLFPSK